MVCYPQSSVEVWGLAAIIFFEGWAWPFACWELSLRFRVCYPQSSVEVLGLAAIIFFEGCGHGLLRAGNCP